MRAPTLLLLPLLLAPSGCAEQADADATGGGATCLFECRPGERRCDGAGDAQICADYDGDGCPEWGEPLACGGRSTCEGGRCVAACAAGCAEGEALCSGGGVRRCAPDSEGCPALGLVEACGDGLRCDDGACVPAEQACADACPTDGAGQCAGDGVRRCGQFDDDPCLELGPTTDCGLGGACRDGQCAVTCADTCSAGDARCNADAVEGCGDFDDDPCLEFGPARACDAGLRCDDGACVPRDRACTNGCARDGEGLCDADGTGIRQCGDFDDDDCLELSPSVQCGPREACGDGRCAEVCTDGCVAATLRCGPTGVEVCGRDGPCLGWTLFAACAADERCERARCTPVGEMCADTCAGDGARCAEGGRQTCGDFDADACLEWGPTEACPAGTACESGACVDVMTPTVVINELFYDAVGDDLPQVFVELHGPARLSLEGWRLVGVNGAGGRAYQTIPLSGVIPADGFFVIARPEAVGEAGAAADLRHANADFQNGPDSVQLLAGEALIDAIAYGAFDGGETAAGEGASAPDVRAGESLARAADHADSGDNRTDFSDGTPTPGR